MRQAVGCGLAMAVLLSTGVAQAAETDIFGREVPNGRGRLVLVLYSNQDTKDVVDVPMTDVSVNLRDFNPMVIIRADLRGVPSIFEGFARRIMKGAFEDGIARYRAKLKELGLPPPMDEGNGLFFVLDSYGKAHEAIGLQKGFKEARAVALDASGNEIARVAFPRQAAELEAAVRKAFEKKAELPTP